MFTDVGFHLKSGFKKILCSQMLVFTLILVSRKFCVHQFFLYRLTEMSVNARDLTDILGKSEISIDKLTENLDSIEMLGDSVLRLEASSKEMLNKVKTNSSQ